MHPGAFSGLLCLLASAAAAAAPRAVQLDPAEGCVDLGPGLEALAEEDRAWSLEEVTRPPLRGRFGPAGPGAAALGQPPLATWVRVEIAGRPPPGGAWHLVVPQAHLYELEAHLPVAGDRPSPPLRLGHLSATPDLAPALALPATGPAVLHLRASSPVFRGLTLLACTGEGLAARERRAGRHAGLVLGLMLALLLLNAVLWLYLADPGHGLLAATLALLAAQHALMLGLGHRLVGPAGQGWLPPLAMGLMGLALYCQVRFARLFLDTARNLPREEQLLQALGWVLLAGVGLAWASMVLAGLGQLLACVLLVGLQPWCGARSLRRGVRHARLFLLGWLLALAPLAVFLLFLSGPLPAPDLAFLAPPLGLVLLTASLTLALLDRHRLEQAGRRGLELARALAEEADRVQGAFLGRMSHEIRTPLAGVVGMAEVLLGGPLDEAQRGHARTVLESARDLTRVIDDMLDLTRIEAGTLVLARVAHEPLHALRRVLELHRPLAAARGVALELELAPDLPASLRGDPARLGQVLTNLVSNALKFTERGEVVVRAGACPGGGLRVEVRDTGVGIPAEEHPRLFQPFSQIVRADGWRRGGTGLGLFISRRLIEGMGGRIGLRSAPGQGSTFWFEVPDAPPGEAPAPPRARPEPAPEGAAPAARVLVVEDDALSQQVALAFLARLGHQASVVPDGPLALERLAAERFDLVLLDLELPGMDGFEVMGHLLSRPPPRPVVVAWTAHTMKGERERCLATGMQDHLAKPTSLEELAAVLARWLPRPGGPT